MGITDRFVNAGKALFSSSSRSDPIDITTQPVDPLVVLPASIIGGRVEDMRKMRQQNRYALADSLYNSDERLYSSIELMAIMIKKSIGDCTIFRKPGEELENLTNEEENAIDIANKFMRDLDVKQLFYNYTIDLWKYGDAVDLIKMDGSGVKELIPLPMQAVTAIDKRDQLNKAINFGEEMISKPKWYVLDEQMTAPIIDNQVFKKDRVLHLSFNPRRNMIRDNLGRWTFNVWSTSPMNSLIGIISWKQMLMRNDMVYRNRALPREHHQLDLSQYDPKNYAGTHSQKLLAAKTDAEKAIREYNSNIRRREADQGYVTGMNTKIGWIQPDASYSDPLPIIDQINNLMNGVTGTPSALMGGESKGFTSLVHSASFLALRAEIYAGVIQRGIEDLIKKHVGIARPGIRREVVNRLMIKNRLILDRDRAELARMVAVLVQSNVFTPDEIRAIWGLDPMTEQQAEYIIEWIKKTQSKGNTSSTTEDLLRQNPSSPTSGQESQGKRSRDLIQKGDDRGRSPI